MHPSSTRSGFTLVEVSLAITIAAVALLAIVSLLPLGYDANRKSMDATRQAQLAEDILAVAKGQADQFVTRADFQTKFASGLQAEIGSPGEWDAAVKVLFDGAQHELVFKPADFPELSNHELTYQASIVDADGKSGRFAKRVVVKIWPGIQPGHKAMTPYSVESIVVGKDLANVP